MSASDDPMDEMDRFLSSHDAERLLDGALPIDDLPAELGPLATLFSSLAAPPVPQDSKAEQDEVATIAAAIRAAARPHPQPAAHARFPRISAKAAAAMLVAMLASGTAVAAAATGSLPSPIQRAVANTLSHFDISVPHPSHHAQVGSTAPKHRALTAPHDGGITAKTPALPGNSVHGLCTAAAQASARGGSGTPPSSSVAFSNLQRAAAAAGKSVTEYCKVAGLPNAGTATTTSTLPVHRKTGKPSTNAPHGPPVTPPAHGNPHPTTPPGNGNANGKGKAKRIATGPGNGHPNGNGGSKSKP